MITLNHHIKFFKSVIFEGTSFRPKPLPAMLNKHSTGQMLHNWVKNSNLAISQENVLLCNNLCPVCTHIQVAIKKVISTFSHEIAKDLTPLSSLLFIVWV